MEEKKYIYFFNIDCGCYLGTIAADTQAEAAKKLYEAFSRVTSIDFGDDVEITELKVIDDKFMNGNAMKRNRQDQLMLCRDYGIIVK